MIVSEDARQRHETYQIQEIRIRGYTKQKKMRTIVVKTRPSNAMYAMQCQVKSLRL